MIKCGKISALNGMYKEAKSWYEKAATYKDDDALVRLGCLYEDNREYQSAMEYFQEASKSGNTYAKYKLENIL